LIAERFRGLDEALVSRERRAIREKIGTEPKIRKWFSGSHQAKHLSQDLTFAFSSLQLNFES
jgi:hypothetical protein